MSEKVIIDGINVSDFSCSECPENEKKRCLEQQEKYKSEIYYLLSFLENDFTKGQIEVLKTKISYPTRCDVVLEKQLQRAKTKIVELKNENSYMNLIFNICKEQLNDYKRAIGNKKAPIELLKIAEKARKENINLTAENERLKECINKIKETLQNEHPFKDCACGQDILDKISEVENG